MIKERLLLLLQIQEQDQRIRELGARIRQLAARKEALEQKIAEERAQLARKEHELQELRQESHRRNDEVDSLDYQIRNYQGQLDQGIMSYREMEALKEKIEHSKRRMEGLEDEAIALMNELEAREETLLQEEKAQQERERGVGDEIHQVERESQACQAELEEARGRRTELAAGVERHLLQQYERLLRDFGYEDPIAHVEDDSCSGCKMRLAQNTLERLREGRELVACENCHRIIYRG